MPDENLPMDPQTPKSQPKLNSLDGFTNSPRPSGPPIDPGPIPSGGLNQSQAPTSFSPKPDVVAPGQPTVTGSVSSGGVTNPTVSGMSGLQAPVPQTPHAPLPPMPDPVPQSQTPVITTHRKSHKKLWMMLAGLLILAGISAGYVYAFYLPNTPNNVYQSSLTNTSLAVDKLIDYSRTQQNAHYKTTSFDGKLNVKSPDVSFDASMNGDISKENGQLSFNADVMSQKVAVNARYVTKSGNDSPDVYLQVSGVKTILNQEGLGPLAKYDSKWIAIDHTLIDTYKSTLQKEAQSMSGSKMQMDKAPTDAQVNDAVDKVQAVNKAYIFTTDPTKAVLTKNQYVGKESVNGREMYHYKVGYSKEHLKAYVNAVCQALDNSQLNDWAKKMDSGKSISEETNCKDAGKSIDRFDSKYNFDMWADIKTKLVGKLTFTDTKNKANTFSLSQNYTGGVVYPFLIDIKSKDDSGNPSNFTLGLNVNSATRKVALTMKGDSKDSSGTTSFDGSLDITPSNKDVVVAVPKGATPIMDLLKSLGLGGTTGSPNIPACKAGDTKCLESNPGCNDPSLYLACALSGTNGGVNPGASQGGITCGTPAAGTAKCLASNTNKT